MIWIISIFKKYDYNLFKLVYMCIKNDKLCGLENQSKLIKNYLNYN